MRILLLAPPVHYSCDVISTRSIPPQAIYLLSSILKSEGFDVRVLDPAEIRKVQPIEDMQNGFIDLLASALDGVNLVGISCNTANWAMAKLISQQIAKLNSEIPIVFGGVHPTYYDEYILSTTSASFVIRGEGEAAIVELARAIEGRRNYSEIKGLSWKRDGKVIQNPIRPWSGFENIRNIPLAEYDTMPENVYYTLPVETSRGCKFSCKFCSVPRRNKWDGFEPDWVVGRISKTINKYRDRFKEDYVFLVDDCFTADHKRAGVILSKLDNAHLDTKYIIEARATDILNPGLIEMIPRHIMQRIAIGVECGYDEGLLRIGKGLSIEQINKCLNLLHKNNLIQFAAFSFIIGFPWENERDCLNTVHFAANLVMEYGVSVNLNWLILMPSQLWMERERYGIHLKECVFDDLFYMCQEKYFSQTHPAISPEVFNRVESTIEKYRLSGYSLRSP